MASCSHAKTAKSRAEQTYHLLVEASGCFTEQGRVVHVCQRVVGIRGMIDPSHVESLLKVFDIQRQNWRVAVERIALASVLAFHFLHKVRFGGRLEAVLPVLDRACSAVVTALRFGTQGPGFEPGLFHKACCMPLHGC
jgi:hypothetical protein